MQNKTKLLAVALFSLLAVTGCDEVVAKPTDYNENIVLNNDGTGLDVPNNEMAKVYDAIRNGSLASDVLNEFLYQYAVSAFGAYNHVTAGADVLTLKDVAKLIIASCSTAGDYDTINADSLKSSKANEFVKNHKAYWTINDAGKRIQYNDKNEAIEVADDALDLVVRSVVAAECADQLLLKRQTAALEQQLQGNAPAALRRGLVAG